MSGAARHAGDNAPLEASAVPCVSVLFVDDEPLLLRSFSRALLSPQFQVETAPGPPAAMRLVEERAFDIVVSDLRMPDGDGIDFLRQVRLRQPSAQRVLITAFADLEATSRAINEAHVVHLLHKPVSISKLRDVLDDLRDQILLQRENEALAERVRRQNEALLEANRNLDSLVRHRSSALLQGMLVALDYRDSETQWHSRRVARYTTALAHVMGIEGDDLVAYRRGALLHDIGKIGIPDEIMLKRGPLDAAEWAVMRTHPELGARLLVGVDFLAEPRRMIREHHERYDGSGYPAGLAGEDIYLGARIFAIADTLDAITSHRPYRAARDFQVAFDEIVKHRGTLFDPDVVDAFRVIPTDTWRAVIEVERAIESGEEPEPEAVELCADSPFDTAEPDVPGQFWGELVE